jgi:Flp pilus assembly protein TadD
MPRSVPAQSSSNVPAGHPNVDREELLAMFKEALEKNPDNPELMTRYANFLFDLGRFNEAVDWFRKAIAIEPNNLGFRTDLGTALWNGGQKDQAMAEYQQILKIDPKHMATLHNIVIVHFEERNAAAAEQVLKQMESIDPAYEGLSALRARLQDIRK